MKKDQDLYQVIKGIIPESESYLFKFSTGSEQPELLITKKTNFNGAESLHRDIEAGTIIGRAGLII